MQSGACGGEIRPRGEGSGAHDWVPPPPPPPRGEDKAILRSTLCIGRGVNAGQGGALLEPTHVHSTDVRHARQGFGRIQYSSDTRCTGGGERHRRRAPLANTAASLNSDAAASASAACPPLTLGDSLSAPPSAEGPMVTGPVCVAVQSEAAPHTSFESKPPTSTNQSASQHHRGAEMIVHRGRPKTSQVAAKVDGQRRDARHMRHAELAWRVASH
ncbi:hypothetical protein L1887_61616 [Cichorium endivia]|nr:hypothetical protein L1887_61616 [Cichorium endivia]